MIKTIAAWVPDALILGGAVALTIGAGMIYQPAGYIVGGLLALASGVMMAKVF